VAEDDRVVTRKTFHGTHQGDLFGIPPTDRAVAFDVIDILCVRDGKITDHWNVVDQLGLMRQIGALPASVPVNA
jgi:predicted ester cyclase